MAYAELAEVRGWLGLPNSYDDPELGYALASAESAIDTHCGYPFSKDTSATAKVFLPTNLRLLDIAAQSFTFWTTSGLVVKSDEDNDGVFEVTWAAADYQLEPLNGRGPGGVTWPYTALRAVGDRWWPVPSDGKASVEITAQWGWTAVPSNVRLATLMLTAAWHQRRNTMTGRGGFDGFFTSAISDDQSISDLLAPFRHGHSIAGIG